MDGVRAGQLDAACVRGPIDAGELSAETIAREPLFAALPAGHVLARRSAVDLRRLSNECLVTFPPEHAAGLADLMCALWDKAGGRPPAQVVADEWVTIVNLVAAGIGVAVVPASVCTLRPAGIVYRPLADCDARAELWLVTRRDTSAAATRALLAACRSIGDAAGTCRKRAALP
jgi:DNA-binding transcriptional LysR family regulator